MSSVHLVAVLQPLTLASVGCIPSEHDMVAQHSDMTVCSFIQAREQGEESEADRAEQQDLIKELQQQNAALELSNTQLNKEMVGLRACQFIYIAFLHHENLFCTVFALHTLCYSKNALHSYRS